MKRNKTKNGLFIEENIELTEVFPKETSVITYLLQAILLLILCLSILYCFLSGMQIKINVFGLNLRILLFMTCLFFIFLLRPYLKYSLPAILFLYVLVGFLWWDDIQAGFARTANAVLMLYNDYFGQEVELLSYNKGLIFDNNNIFIYYIGFLLSAILCYLVIYGKHILYYLILTGPLVFSPLIVGMVPDSLPLILYIASTLGIMGSYIQERYNYSGPKKKKRQALRHFYGFSSAKVVIQVASFVGALVIVLLAYKIYSPERYETEFQAEEIRVTVKDKFDEIMSGDLLKDTVFGEIFSGRSAKGGMNMGELNRIDSITFTHDTALKVKTVLDDVNGPCYLRGYVGEQYSSRKWSPLSDKDQKRLKDLESSFTLAKNAESLESAMINLLASSPYQVNTFRKKSMEVEVVDANSDVSYVPYNMLHNVSIKKGAISSKENSYTYADFGVITSEGSPLSETYKSIDMSTVLQLNLINSKIYERVFNVDMDPDWENKITGNDFKILNDFVTGLGSDIQGTYQNLFQIPLNNVYSGVTTLPDPLPLYVNKETYVISLGDIIAALNEYAKEENAYYTYVRDVYTKLPETGLKKVKDVVKGYEVQVDPTVLQGDTYTTLEQLGSVSGVEEAYADRNVFNQQYQKIEDEEKTIREQYYDAIEFVRNYLAINTSYDLNPGRAPSGEDFVEYFLFKNKKGYCVHYASAATVMLRAMGVPARYVEGYVVTNEDLLKGTKVGNQVYTSVDEVGDEILNTGQEVLATIEDTNAHAWVEVYMPGLGWQPIEMTAPYIYDSQVEIPPVNDDPTATLKPTPTPTYTPPTSTPKPSTSPKATAKITPKPSIKPIGNGASASDGLGLWGGLKTWYNKLPHTTKKLILMVLILLLTVVLLAGLLYLRYRIVLNYRAKKKHLLSNNEWVLYANRHFDTILKRFHLVYQSSEPHEVFVKKLVEKFSFVEKAQAEAYYALILKARFYKEQLSDEEVQVCEAFYATYREGLLNRAGRIKKWIYTKLWMI